VASFARGLRPVITTRAMSPILLAEAFFGAMFD
jgi:hypothetical protein